MKKLLNLYAGIGGNRKDWKDVEVTAIEYNEEIANIYKQLHPNDNVIVTDAHEYLAKHWMEFDFIWSSPPCQSHSKVRMMASKSGSYDAVMPDMRLWAEIIFLQNFTKNTDIKFVVENVKPYYEPFVKPTAKLGRHLFWANFEIPETEIKDGLTHNERGSSEKGYFDLRPYKIKHRKDQIIRNCVDPNIGKYVLDCAFTKHYEGSFEDFQEWLKKYFSKPKVENIYNVKNKSEYFIESELLAKYKKSVGKK